MRSPLFLLDERINGDESENLSSDVLGRHGLPVSYLLGVEQRSMIRAANRGETKISAG